ncbi:hypothetical protein H7I53_24605 [Mycolicibacterium pulveris]|uniref:Uncharacterized protein n=1 Tax=Mycolicibacterium pulveris TaxID=36813 RepID=A0A7I7UR62_MYCPV|nr:hypothetical protein [Mycolicibacterium pulveris]MCV6983384.1 hypothetical protein [Mycolicibacterium pulveris]BBY83261.1 hypothetical protein MPUL_44190 [Mycolicibacterium pulveris]
MRPKQAKGKAPVRDSDERRRNPRNARNVRNARAAQRRPADAPPRRKPTREQRPTRSAPQTGPIRRPVERSARPKNTSQAKARAKARKAKAPKVVRPPLRERLIVKLASIDLNPRTLVARVPFVVLVIGSLGLGLGITLWLSTDAAERSYQLGNARQTNQALLQQKEALERDVLEAQAAPALAEAARDLGMIPSRDTAHLVQDPAGNWIVVGTPKPAEGVPPPPLNTPLPEATPSPPPSAAPGPRVIEPLERSVRLPSTTEQVPGALPQAQVPGALPQAQVPDALPQAQVPPGVEVPYAVSPPVPQQAVPAQPPALAPPDGQTLHVPAQGLPGPMPTAQQPLPAAAPAVGNPA